MKYKSKKVSKHIYWDTYWITNDILSTELLEKELTRLENTIPSDNSPQWRIRERRISVVQKELLNY